MHPFSLNDLEIEQVSGGLNLGGELPDDRYFGPAPGEETTLAIGEEGGFPPGELTTMAMGEEGGSPIFLD